MKIEKVKSRKYKNTQYYKYRVIIPENKLNEAELKEGDNLEIKTKKGELKLKRKNERIN